MWVLNICTVVSTNSRAKSKYKQMDMRLAQNSLNPGKMLCAKVHRSHSRCILIKFSRNQPIMKMAVTKMVINDEDSANSTQAKVGRDKRRLPSFLFFLILRVISSLFKADLTDVCVLVVWMEWMCSAQWKCAHRREKMFLVPLEMCQDLMIMAPVLFPLLTGQVITWLQPYPSRHKPPSIPTYSPHDSHLKRQF